MSDYLKPTDADAFKDMGKKLPEPASKMFGAYSMPRCASAPVAECGKCHGYGGWNLKLDAYGPGRHFRASCNNCTGWGYVPEAQGSHVHEWDRGETIGNCLTRYTCASCKEVNDVDSSD